MRDWIQILLAFMHDDTTFQLGTKEIDDVKVLTADKQIVVQKDARYAELKNLGKIFSA